MPPTPNISIFERPASKTFEGAIHSSFTDNDSNFFFASSISSNFFFSFLDFDSWGAFFTFFAYKNPYK